MTASKRHSPLLAVVVTVLNEGENILPVCTEIRDALADLPATEVIFVDDGSTDDTHQKLLKVREQLLPELRILTHPVRLGKSTALRTAIRAARAPWIATMDGDGQDDPGFIKTMFEAALTYEDDQFLQPLPFQLRSKQPQPNQPQSSQLQSARLRPLQPETSLPDSRADLPRGIHPDSPAEEITTSDFPADKTNTGQTPVRHATANQETDSQATATQTSSGKTGPASVSPASPEQNQAPNPAQPRAASITADTGSGSELGPHVPANATRRFVGPLVVGIRRKRQDRLSRKLATRFANGLRQRLLKDDCPDTGAPLKLFRRDLFLALPQFEGLHRFIPALMKTYGAPLLCIETQHRPRLHGHSKYTNFNRALVGIRDLLGVIWLQNRIRSLPPPDER